MKSSAQPKVITFSALRALILATICYLPTANVQAQDATYNDVTVTGTLSVDNIETLSGELLETTFGEGNTVTGDHAFAFGEGNQALGFHSATWGGSEFSNGMPGNLAEGYSSTAWGAIMNRASGSASTAWGDWGNHASGHASTTWGFSWNIAEGLASTAFGGFSNHASGNYSTVWGLESNYAYGEGATAWGERSVADAYLSTTFGRANRGGYAFLDDGNDNNDGDTQWFDLDPLFEVGNGTDDQNRSNAITTLKNGKTTLENKHWDASNPTTVPTDSDASDGVALEVKGHVEIQGNTTIAGTLEVSSIAGAFGAPIETTFGEGNTVTGEHAVAFGQGNRSTGYASTSWGGVRPTDSWLLSGSNYATGDYSTAWGREYNYASGEASTVFGGVWNSAAGQFSTAWGYIENSAQGIASTAFGGYLNQAVGDYSTVWGEGENTAHGVGGTAWGYESVADAYLSTTFGRANRGGYAFLDDGNDNNDGDTQWFELDPLFEVGNGSNRQNRSNAITTLKNGKTTLENKHWDASNPTTVPTDSDASDGVALEVKGHVHLEGRTTITYIVRQGDVPMFGQ